MKKASIDALTGRGVSLDPELTARATPTMGITWGCLTIGAIYAFRWIAAHREEELIREVKTARNLLKPYEEETERLRERCSKLIDQGDALQAEIERRDILRPASPSAPAEPPRDPDLICKRCDVAVGLKASGVAHPVPGKSHEWHASHCWICHRSSEEIETDQRLAEVPKPEPEPPAAPAA